MQQPPRPPNTSAGPVGVHPPGTVAINSVQVMRPGAPGPQRSVATVSPRVIVGNTVQRPASIPPQILQNVQGSSQGHLLLKTDNGQYQLLRVGPGSMAAALNAQAGRPATMAALPGTPTPSQSAVTIVPTMLDGQEPKHLAQQQLLQLQQLPQQRVPQRATLPQQQPIASISNMPDSQNAFSQPGPRNNQELSVRPLVSQRPPDNTKEKCRNFLANLLELSTKEPPSVETNVRNLIQELIDGAVEPDAFCDRLERLLNASPQPCLIGFLKKSLPLLRQSMVLGDLVIQGIMAPPYRVAFPPLAGTPAPSISVPNLPFNVPMTFPTTTKASGPGISVAQSRLAGKPSGAGGGKSMTVNKQASLPRPQPAPSTVLAPGKSLLKERERKSSAFQGAFNDDKMTGDDDINDVAAMGGVNLQEETQRILGNTEMIGSQIRSCKEEYLVPSAALQARIREKCAARGLEEPPLEVAQLMSHALAERMKSILEQLTCSALHRQDTECKTDGRYEVTQDVKGQLKFLEELDRVEKKRREDSERELLLRAAKSRSKTEDPEQAKLKAKAKEMQRAEMEELRQREANLTALQAIGPRKKPRIEQAPESTPATAGSQPQPTTASGSRAIRTRMKRITLRDMLHMLENDRVYARSSILYKAYLKA